jgi:penicillin-binding protein-related factor A (putative recombinase)
MGMGQPCLDCHGCYNGLYFAVETKATGKKPTLRQETTIKRIRAAGGLVFVVDSTEKANAILSDCVEIDWTTADTVQRQA